MGHARPGAAQGRARAAGPRRQGGRVAAWNGLTIAALAEAGGLLDEPEYVEAAARAARLLLDVHLDGRTLRRVSRGGVVGRPAGVLEDYGCVAGGLLTLFQVTGSAEWLAPAELLLDEALARFAADGGGFFDPASDAESLVARPRDPPDNASPSGQSALVHALVTWSALTGSGRHRDAAEAALRGVRRLAEQAPRFAGWSLAAAEAMLAGPLEVAVVGRGDDREALLSAARRSPSPGAVVVAGEPGSPPVLPLLEGRDLIEGRAAAYVCRAMDCRRPVTTVDALTDEVSGGSTSRARPRRSGSRTPRS
jgi:uncharacterized protein YyaL (SSP411 family)